MQLLPRCVSSRRFFSSSLPRRRRARLSRSSCRWIRPHPEDSRPNRDSRHRQSTHRRCYGRARRHRGRYRQGPRDHQHRRPRRRRHRADGAADRGEGAGRPDRGGLSRFDAANLQLHARSARPWSRWATPARTTSTRTAFRSLIRSRRRSSRPRPAMPRRPPRAPGAEARTEPPTQQAKP